MARPAAATGSEPVLLARLQAGDETALAEAYQQWGGYVYGLARRVTGSTAAAEDLTQEIFVRLWERPHDVDLRRGSIRTYLGVITHRRSVDWVRSESRRQIRDDKAAHQAPTDPDVAEVAANLVVADHVRAALDALPESQRVAITLAYFEGLTYREVASRLGIPEGTAKSRLRLALAKLADLLDTESVTS